MRLFLVLRIYSLVTSEERSEDGNFGSRLGGEEGLEALSQARGANSTARLPFFVVVSPAANHSCSEEEGEEREQEGAERSGGWGGVVNGVVYVLDGVVDGQVYFHKGFFGGEGLDNVREIPRALKKN